MFSPHIRTLFFNFYTWFGISLPYVEVMYSVWQTGVDSAVGLGEPIECGPHPVVAYAMPVTRNAYMAMPALDGAFAQSAPLASLGDSDEYLAAPVQLALKPVRGCKMFQGRDLLMILASKHLLDAGWSGLMTVC
jgi:hypothetical protein